MINPLFTKIPDFTLGIEEEYLLVDLESRDLVTDAPKGLMEECEAILASQVSPEFLQCQIEVGTKVCSSLAEARTDLVHLRSTIAKIANQHGLAPIAASTHPFAKWAKQHTTDRQRYHNLEEDLQGVGHRLLICGMHVHVGIDDEETRIDIANQLPYFLPHLLALSCSSPFWQGRDSGLNSYRLSIFDNLPRTGLPPIFSSWGEYERTIATLIDNGLIENATKIWWDLRPSHRFPTLEMRICDVPTRLDDSISIAALYVCLTRMMFRLRRDNLRWRQYERFLINENRWRAQRYGCSSSLIDFGSGRLKDFLIIIDELIELIMVDAIALNCVKEVNNARKIVERGNSATMQRQAYEAAIEQGRSINDALKMVVDMLVEQSVAGF